MKASLFGDSEAVDRLRQRIASTERFRPHLREDEPDWNVEVDELGLPERTRSQFLTELKVLWILPLADVPAVRELLLFKYLELPRLEKRNSAPGQRRFIWSRSMFEP
jgi:hypothetical protein